jgi:tetratricopeptide (TPR) repeat protein
MAMRRVGFLAIGLLASTVAHGQSPVPAARVLTDYREAVRVYQRGAVDTATEALSRWSPELLKRTIDALAEDRSEWRLAEAAALLHTEFIVRNPAITDAALSLHLGLAQRLIDALSQANPRAPSRPGADIEAFQRRWYALAASVYLASTNPSGASRYIDRGRRLFKNDGRLQMLAGVAEEMRSHLADGNLHDPQTIHGMSPNKPRQSLLWAEGEFRRALALDPSLDEARLRLGRVLALRNEPGEARVALTAVTRSAAPPRIRYLAHLFLGGLAEYQHDLMAAQQAYRDALAIGPDRQTPYIALTFVEHAMGHDQAARDLMARYTALPNAAGSDPWSNYQNGGLDEESLVWLRAQVRP